MIHLEEDYKSEPRPWGNTHNVNALVAGNTNLGALRTQIYTDDTHYGIK
jgi:hypothetical protein